MTFPLRSMLAVAVAAAIPAIAQAANTDEPWYAGAKVGWSDFYSQEYGAGLRSGDTSDGDKVGAGVFAGYQFNDWFALEGGYDWLGKDGLEQGTLSGKQRFQGIQLSGKFSAPLTDSLDAYARLGVMGYRASGDFGSKHDGAAPLAALGLEYNIDRNWSTRFEYQYAHHLGKTGDNGLRNDNGLLSLGVAYHFGGAPAVVPVAAPAPAPVAPPAPQLMEFKLKGDVLFAFNSAQLNDAGRAELTTILQQIKAAQPQQAAINIAGYTDRIGSDAYNLKLSKARAASVGDFLVSQGVPAGIISAEGFGKADQVVACDGVKPRAELIKCLEPNRRVIIRAQGMAAQQ